MFGGFCVQKRWSEIGSAERLERLRRSCTKRRIEILRHGKLVVVNGEIVNFAEFAALKIIVRVKAEEGHPMITPFVVREFHADCAGRRSSGI